jgi:NADH-quinone oxidoreductase subunit C
MEPVEIAERIKDKFPGEFIEMVLFREQVSVSVKRDKITAICRFLFDDPDIQMNYLSDLCGVDYKERRLRFEVVYNLYSLKYRHAIRLKALIPGDDPSIDSVVNIWSGANWHERETYDMFGIIFNGHPDMRRILMPSDWEGHPLRKDYPVKGPDEEYKGFEKIKELHAHDNEWKV